MSLKSFTLIYDGNIVLFSRILGEILEKPTLFETFKESDIDSDMVWRIFLYFQPQWLHNGLSSGRIMV